MGSLIGKVVIIVQARMTSTRLPGKVLLPVRKKPLLQYQIERLQRVKGADAIVIATTTNVTDDPIVDLCDYLHIPVFRGSEEDVLARYAGAATACFADTIVRVTSDCPLIDPAVIDQVIETYRSKYPACDYVSNVQRRTYPRGMDVEVFSSKALFEAFDHAKNPPDREHVTHYLYNSGRFHLGSVTYSSDQSHHRWTVDTPEDFELIKKILEAIYPVKPEFTIEDLLELLKKNPAWEKINQHVEQKTTHR